MTPAPRPGRGRVVFDERRWADDLARSTEAGRLAAERWRTDVDRDGLDLAQLRRCEAEHRDGTSLPGCMKVYVPAPDGPWGVVMDLVHDEVAGGHALSVLAFALRHPPSGSRRPSVYQLAHRRLDAGI